MGAGEAYIETTGKVEQTSLWIGTSNRGFGKLAINELSRLFGGKVKTQSLSPGDVFRFEAPFPRSEVLRKVHADVPIFLRHLQPVDAVLPAAASLEEALERIVAWAREADLPVRGKKTAVQARKAEAAAAPAAVTVPIEVKRAVDQVLTEVYGAIPTVREMEYVISVYEARDGMYVGGSQPQENLSSWSGGAIHFRKEEGDISRAKFKLMEAEIVFGLDFSKYDSALDLGAAPGGWSSFLLEKGLRVTAVDPADMHPSLLQDRRFTYLRNNAADVQFPPDAFDLLVCDMSWDPEKMAELVKRLLPAVQEQGLILTTVKLLHGKAFATLRKVEQIMEPEAKLVKAKQLFHNREEITCLWKRT